MAAANAAEALAWAPTWMRAKTRGNGVSDEERRIHRNTLVDNAEAGCYGAEFRRAAMSRQGLRELADELKRLKTAGNLKRGFGVAAP